MHIRTRGISACACVRGGSQDERSTLLDLTFEGGGLTSLVEETEEEGRSSSLGETTGGGGVRGPAVERDRAHHCSGWLHIILNVNN